MGYMPPREYKKRFGKEFFPEKEDINGGLATKKWTFS
tara:strand:- start:309 stop:419 length:111 start_codon:yes stop_codon:yes gene_type:complete